MAKTWLPRISLLAMCLAQIHAQLTLAGATCDTVAFCSIRFCALRSAARAKNVSFVIGSSLNAGFISGSPRYNYGKESYKIPAAFIEKRRKLLDVAANHGVDLRTAALQFSAAPDVASALVVGCKSEQQILADYTSMQTKIPAEFWADLKARNLIEQNAPVPA